MHPWPDSMPRKSVADDMENQFNVDHRVPCGSGVIGAVAKNGYAGIRGHPARLTDITGDTILLQWKSFRTPMSSSLPCAAQREPVRRFWTGVWPGLIKRSWDQPCSRSMKIWSIGKACGGECRSQRKNVRRCWTIFALRPSGSPFISDGGPTCRMRVMIMFWSLRSPAAWNTWSRITFRTSDEVNSNSLRRRWSLQRNI